ncbi:MAG TPA: DNRLRE domain-containing protein [Chitinophaga sp.]|uniref:CBM96 family carbohydrate-binding protein n=1 Tax=Chitinophaga sp. TaxID=1869181 RepID=UPI002C774BA8|nr:DNRLRE domain-containing protein [Chitinophaga sp.]HVI43410.1 DNRLRE domain-containing protein [Chitinophaga sp.]
MKQHYLHRIFLRSCPAFFLLACCFAAKGQVTLQANGQGGAYQLIESKGFGVESPDCKHPSFGPHVTQTFDNTLGRYVFVFHSHPVEDDDRCTNEDRTRMEIKGGSGSEAEMQHTEGQTAYYRWKFKLDAGFIPSGRFTHIFQIKAMDGDAGAPLITITPRAGTPQKLQIIHSSGSGSGGLGTVAQVDLAPFKGVWVEAYVKYKSAEDNAGTFEITLKRVSDGVTLLSYSKNGIDMWRTGASYNRPKWGVYRGKDPVLRNEQVLFNDFCISESSADLCPSDVGGTNHPPVVSVTAPAGGATFTAPANVTINASASDADGSISKVEFFNGTQKLGEDVSSPYSFGWSNVSAGNYSLTAKATDNKGAVTTSAPVSISVSGAPGCVPATASADDGNVAANVLDNNLSTRWSASGDGQWIQLCLADTLHVSGVQIAFYKGDTRTSTFDVLTGNDGVNWTTAATRLVSNGSSLNLQSFLFSARSARYIRIVGHGNSQDLWNSYTEIKAITSTSSLTLSPSQDAYVRDGANASTTYGTMDAALLISKLSPAGQLNNAREIYITFNISSAGNQVSGAVLKLYGKLDGTSETSVPTAVFAVSDTSWKESTVTWNNKPTTGSSIIASQTVTNAAATWYSWDITAYVQQELTAGHQTISLALKSQQAHDQRILLNSKEAGSNTPQLVLGTDTVARKNTATVMAVKRILLPESSTTLVHFPNPFRDNCLIRITLKETGDTRLTVYDIQGRPVEILLNTHLPAGVHNVTLHGSKLPAGVYTLQLLHNGKVSVSKLLKQ